MTILADLAMLLWPLVVLCIFSQFRAPRAVAIAIVAGWLILPFKSYSIAFFPDITKASLTCVSVLFAAAIFDAPRLSQFRFRWFDWAAVLMCVVPVVSSLSNNLGTYDAIAVALSAMLSWGIPYFLGRVYLNEPAAVRDFAITILIGTLFYLPLCWFEMRMSPQLHTMVYGETHRFGGLRLGGWRPAVFLDSGLQLGLWMTNASLIAIWLWWTGAWRKWAGISSGVLTSAMVVTTILCRSTGALLLLVMGVGALATLKYTRSRIGLCGLLLIAPLYVGLRATGEIDWTPAVEVARVLDDDRAQSLEFRFKNEDILGQKALERPFFGWGGWGRSRVYDEYGKDISITDGLWIIIQGQHGLVGLTAFYTLLLLPLALICWRVPIRAQLSKELAPTLSLAVVAALFAIDCIPNGMECPVYVVAVGAVAGCIDRVKGQMQPPTGTRVPLRSHDAHTPRQHKVATPN